MAGTVGSVSRSKLRWRKRAIASLARVLRAPAFRLPKLKLKTADSVYVLILDQPHNLRPPALCTFHDQSQAQGSVGRGPKPIRRRSRPFESSRSRSRCCPHTLSEARSQGFVIAAAVRPKITLDDRRKREANLIVGPVPDPSVDQASTGPASKPRQNTRRQNLRALTIRGVGAVSYSTSGWKPKVRRSYAEN